MSNSLAFYRDAGLVALADVFDAQQTADGNAAAVDRVFYLGSTAAGKVFRSSSNPGVDAISVAPAISGAGLATTAIRLASSAAGLNSATPGAALAVGVEILSGAGNAVAVHVRIDAPAIAGGEYSNLRLVSSETMELTVA